jgi:hypothetical protein
MVYESYLSHHGIDGQKWGVKNGPPYPLTNSQKSSAEKDNQSTTKNGLSTSDKIAIGVSVMTTLTSLSAVAVGAILYPPISTAVTAGAYTCNMLTSIGSTFAKSKLK